MIDFKSLLSHLKPKVKLGNIVMTPNAMRALEPEDIMAGLLRHLGCDWGDVCPEDREANDSALKSGGRLLSVYHDRKAVKFWIITEADRTATTVLLPDDY